MDKKIIVLEHKIINGDKPLIYSLNSGILFTPDDTSYNIFKYLTSNKDVGMESVVNNFSCSIPENEVYEIIQELTKVNLISDDESLTHTDAAFGWHTKQRDELFLPRNISLNITHNCNLNCKYCYGDGGSYGSKGENMSLSTAKSSVDFLVGNLVKGNLKEGSLVFFGGEPLINFDIIEDTIKYANNAANEHQVKISYGMTTNGTLMTEPVARKLNELEVHPMFSIDGPACVHDHLRPYSNGKPSFIDVVNGAKTYTKVSGKRVSARVTYIDYNLKELSVELYKLGFKNVHLSICTGELGSHFLTEDGVMNLLKAYDVLYDFYFNRVFQSLDKVDNLDELRFPASNIFVKAMRSVIDRKPLAWPCGAGRSYVAIAPDGSIFLCHRFDGNDKYRHGNINDTNIHENDLYKFVINNVGYRNNYECKNCWIRRSCAGGCMHSNHIETGDILKTHAMQCEIYRGFTELTMKYYHRLYTKNPKLLNAICQIKEPIEYQQ